MAEKSKIYTFMTGKFEEKDGGTRFEVLAISTDGNVIADEWAPNKEEAQTIIGAAPDAENRFAHAATYFAAYPDGYEVEWVEMGNVAENAGAHAAIQKMDERSTEEAAQPAPKPRQIEKVMKLPCPIPDSKVAEYGRKLAAVLADMDQAAEDLKASTKEAKGEIAEMEKEVRALRRAVTEQVYDEDVDCRVDYNWGTNLKEVYRTDTGEFVTSEEISDEERQETADIDGEPKTQEGGTDGLPGNEDGADAGGTNAETENTDGANQA